MVKDKVALVTGASSGIGRAVAEKLALNGARVAVCARRTERLSELQNKLGDKAQMLVLQTDLRQEPQILSLFQKIKDAWGGVDILVNNAGLSHRAPLVSGSTDDWREILDVNVMALCICTREAIQQMQERKVAGHIVHISSMAAHRVPHRSGLYSASKFAVRALTEGLRQELRDMDSPIRVAAISPALVETEFMAQYLKDEQQAQEIYSRFKALEAEDVVNAVMYVLCQPPHVQVHDVLLRSIFQTS